MLICNITIIKLLISKNIKVQNKYILQLHTQTLQRGQNAGSISPLRCEGNYLPKIPYCPAIPRDNSNKSLSDGFYEFSNSIVSTDKGRDR